jgi:uncharacterized membrane protein HdeD (DUF308 family)
MHPQIARAWSVLLIRGVCNVLFAFIAFLQPGLTLVALVLFWGVYAVVDGAMLLSTGIAALRTGARHWALILSGASGLVCGITACIWPGVTLLVLLAIMSAWAILRGVLEIAAAGSLRHVMPRAWLLAVSGAVSVVFGALLLAQPAITLITLVFLVAGAALASGIMVTVLALHLRRLTLERGTPPHLVL